ncbi:MAG TPA: helix-turn-helix domain-containing protein [Candidatus Acidoferrales bacterium]|nr:helix-turn-helix domain-containing protein [Candidatus Acidoferrales bacterium]
MERHLIIQELALRPSGEWKPEAQGWTVVRVAEGAGYCLQGPGARELNPGDAVITGPANNVILRASQLGIMKLEFFLVLPQYLNGLLTVTEWRQLEDAAKDAAPHVLHFHANEPAAQKFTRIAGQKQRDCLSSRSAMLQLWASSINGLLPARDPAGGGVQLRDRFREFIGKMSESELATRSLSELAGQLHCSERHFSRLFREEFNISLRSRQTELRLQRARQLLAATNAKIINVAYESGYRHLGLFNQMFKRRFGLTPSAWRQKNLMPAGDDFPNRGGGIAMAVLLILMQVFFSTDVKAQTAGTAAVTNTAPKFKVEKYLVSGNTILPPDKLGSLFTNIPESFGTNVTFAEIRTALGNLQTAYRERGFVTVSVGLPPQKLTNDTVKVKVTEGHLAVIKVEGNNWFSTPNVLRSLPSLHTNMLLNSHVFQRELDLANANRDRQIYPVIGPGPEPGTSELTLKVKDRFPVHSRVEYNNTGTAGTPDDRVAFNAQYDNLWELEHQIGVQYTFTPVNYKNANPYGIWDPDLPLVDNYSIYYRLPLGRLQSVQQQIDQSDGRFGYNESTHQFQMPPPSGRPDLTFYGSRAVSDTGVLVDPITPIIDSSGTMLGQQTVTENVSLNESLGYKLSMPLPGIRNISSAVSMGMDYKHYEARTVQADVILYSVVTTNGTSPIKYGDVFSTAHFPPTSQVVDYFPLNFGISGSAPDRWGSTTFNAQANYNIANIGSLSQIAYSASTFVVTSNSTTHTTHTSTNNQASDNYFTLQGGVTRDQRIYKDWDMLLRVDGQWSSSPLFSNEQYAMGGLSGVRGYSEGQAYGDTGWRTSIEPRTPLVNIGMVDGNVPFWLRGSVFMDYGEIYLLQQTSATSRDVTRFWGAGAGLTANIGNHIDARLTVAFPLLTVGNTSAGDMHVYFAIGGQL